MLLLSASSGTVHLSVGSTGLSLNMLGRFCPVPALPLLEGFRVWCVEDWASVQVDTFQLTHSNVLLFTVSVLWPVLILAFLLFCLPSVFVVQYCVFVCRWWCHGRALLRPVILEVTWTLTNPRTWEGSSAHARCSIPARNDNLPSEWPRCWGGRRSSRWGAEGGAATSRNGNRLPRRAGESNAPGPPLCTAGEDTTAAGDFT